MVKELLTLGMGLASVLVLLFSMNIIGMGGMLTDAALGLGFGLIVALILRHSESSRMLLRRLLERMRR